MLITGAKLKINGSEYDILRMNYGFYRKIDHKGRPGSGLRGGSLCVQFESGRDNPVLQQMLLEDVPPVRGCIEVVTGQDGQRMRYIEFEAAYICSQEENMFAGSVYPMLTTVVISPVRLDIDSKVRLDRRWPETYGFWWQTYRPENMKCAKKEATEEKKPVTVLVRKVKGPEMALVGSEAEYEVTGYNIREVSSHNKLRIKWVVETGSKRYVQTRQGEKIRITLAEAWVGKEITVMAYLKEPAESVSVKTRVERWFLPRVLVQTRTKEGFGTKSERSQLEYEDCEGKGLIPVSAQIAVDMHYGDGKTHTGHFTLGSIKDANVLQNINELNLRYNDSELFKLFRELIRYTSMGSLESHNLEMVGHVQKQTYQNPQMQHKDRRLTEAVFGHKSTKDFVKIIQDAFKYAMTKSKGNFNKVDILKAFEDTSFPKRPSFSGKMDRLKGLTIALNDTWGFRVTITHYSLNPDTKECTAVLRYRIFDHFGLDTDDIESYGTKEKVMKKLGGLGTISDHITMPRDERVNPLIKQSVARSVAEEVANGFCAWFILQHLRGYKPFVTIMETEETLTFSI